MYPARIDAAGRARRFTMILGRCRALSRTAALVVEHLHWCESKHGQATPSHAGMAAQIGRCERSVSRAVGELERAGLVSVLRDRPHCRKDGTWARHRTNLYRLKWPPKGRVVPARTEGTSMSHLSDSHSNRTLGGATRTAPTPPSGDEPTLFPPDPPPDPPRKPTPPPWVTEGITRDEWMQRFK